MMRTVKNTVRTGRTVVCTIHQPSIDIFEVRQLAETPASCISWFTKVINRLLDRVTPNHCCCCSRLSWPSLIALRPDLYCRASLRVSWQVMVLEVMHGQNKGKHVFPQWLYICSLPLQCPSRKETGICGSKAVLKSVHNTVSIVPIMKVPESAP